MEKIYPKKQESCKLVQARPETIRFLLDYSKALSVVEYKNMEFDNFSN